MQLFFHQMHLNFLFDLISSNIGSLAAFYKAGMRKNSLKKQRNAQESSTLPRRGKTAV